MNRDFRALYAAIEGNEIVCFETNLSDFHKKFKKMEPGSPAYLTFYRRFKLDYKFTKTISGKEYHFQKVL